MRQICAAQLGFVLHRLKAYLRKKKLALTNICGDRAICGQVSEARLELALPIKLCGAGWYSGKKRYRKRFSRSEKRGSKILPIPLTN